MSRPLFPRFHLPSFLPLFMVITAGAAPMGDLQSAINQAPALPGEACQTAPLAGWTEQEQWVWDQVCAGEVADFNAADGYGGALDPNDPEGWPANRVLRPVFLETILLYEPFRSALTYRGVSIEGAWFQDSIFLSNATLAHPLLLHASRFESDVSLIRLRTPHLLSLIGSTFSGELDMNSLQLERDLFMRNARFAAVELIGARIEGQLDMGGSTFSGLLNMNSLRVEGSVFMRSGAQFAEVDLGSARIGDQLDVGGSTFSGQLNMNSLRVEGSLLMRDGASFAGVDLGSAQIGGQLVMDGSTFSGDLNLNSVQVASNLFMREQAEFAAVDLKSARIGGQIDMGGSTFSSKLDMNSVQVDRSLFMREGASFADVDLKSARIGGQLNMIGSTFSGLLDMDGLQVDSLALMRNAHFAEVILRGARIRDQLDMDGATFGGRLNLSSLQLESDLFMREKAEFGEVNLIGARIGGQLNMNGSTFSGLVDMNSVQVAGSLLMREGASFAEVDLGSARIGGQLNMNGSTFGGRLYMDALQVESLLLMRNARFTEVVLRGAGINDQVDMDGSTFSGRLNMDSLQVASHLFVRNAQLAEVNLILARIGGQLALNGSTFSGDLNMDSLQVESDLFMRNVQVNSPNEVNMVFIEVGETLGISNAHLPTLNLTGARIHGEFRLAFSAEDAPEWQEGSKLVLRNAEVGAIQDAPEAWPGSLDLEGFSYTRLGGFSEQSESDMATRDFAWFIGWLEKTERYSPQPYEQLASTLRSAGRLDEADEVLLAGRNRERRESQGLRWVGLSLLKVFIGYGYHIYLALIWFVIFVLLGWIVLKRSGQDRAHEEPLGIDFSLDLLLPVIELRKTHYEIELPRRVRYYFYVHMLMGYVLVLFLLAGLSGLTK